MVGQGRGRLVHDEDAHVLEEHPGDLDELLLADRQLADEHVGVEVLLRAVARASAVRRRCAAWSTNRRPGRSSRPAKRFSAIDMFGKRLSSWWMMPMPCAIASRGLPMLDGLVVEQDRARARLLGAGEDLHEGRLAGAVLTDEDVDLASEGLEVDALEGAHAAVGLRHVDGAQDDRIVGRGGGRRFGSGSHDAASSWVGTMSTTPGATSEKAPAKVTFLPTRSLAFTLDSTSDLTLVFSCVAASA